LFFWLSLFEHTATKIVVKPAWRSGAARLYHSALAGLCGIRRDAAWSHGAAINIIVAPWFDSRRGVALSWAMNGASAGGIIIAPLLTFLIANFGFAFAIASVSASMLATLIPVAIVVLRPRRANEYDPVERAADPDTAPRSSPASAGEASSLRLITLLSRASSRSQFHLHLD
jgi:MFS family permease